MFINLLDKFFQMVERITKADLKILLVDDSVDAVKLLKKFLSEQGFAETFAAPSGESAICTLKNKAYVPSLAIIDTEMSGGISGVETLRRVRVLEGYLDLPIIGASSNEEYEKFWMREGADTFFCKSYLNYENLGQIIQKVFENRGIEICN